MKDAWNSDAEKEKKMRSLADIPERIKSTYPPEIIEAINRFSSDELKELKCYFNIDTHDFDCIAFVGPGGKVCKPADVEKYKALLVLEEQVRRELVG